MEGFRRDIRSETIGTVIESGDGIVRIYGLADATAQEMIVIETSGGAVPAIVFNLEEGSVGAIILGEADRIKEGDAVRQTGRVLSFRVGDSLIGRVIDPLGNALDGRGPLFSDNAEEIYYPIERPAPSVIEREPVATPLHTGIKAIDSMIPIGRGQRELIIGDRQTGKTSIAMDTIIHQGRDRYSPTPLCIYVAIGQKAATVAKLVAMLKEHEALSYSIVVVASASSSAAFRYLAPYVGCAIGEFFMRKGKDALVVYDDLTKHAWAYRELSLLLRRPPGREAYPGDIFYLHARLLERAAALDEKHGGGSLTALPIIETQLGDVSAYIPTNVISITDGQIYLEPELFHQGVRPAVNVGLSVSRVGSRAQTKAMKKVAGPLRLELAQFRELAAFVQFSSELDESTRKRIEHGRALTEILKQPEREPMPFERETALIFAGTQGYFDDIPPEEIMRKGTALLDYLEKMHKEDILKTISQSGELSAETEDLLRATITEWKKL